MSDLNSQPKIDLISLAYEAPRFLSLKKTNKKTFSSSNTVLGIPNKDTETSGSISWRGFEILDSVILSLTSKKELPGHSLYLG